MLPIVVRDGSVSLLMMMEEPPLELVPHLEVVQEVNTWVVVSCLFLGIQVVRVVRV